MSKMVIGKRTAMRLAVCLGCATLIVFSYVTVSSRSWMASHQDIGTVLPSKLDGHLEGGQGSENGDVGIILNTMRERGRREHAVVPVECKEEPQRSEIMAMKRLKFLKQYKNPCWWEPINMPIDDLYKDNLFSSYSYAVLKSFRKVQDALSGEVDGVKYRLRCLPYFLIAGQPKCGSTDLYNRITNHPDIIKPPIKEPHWWGKNRYGWCVNFTSTIPLADYVDLFDRAALSIEQKVIKTEDGPWHPLITVDASVSTLWSNDDWWKNPENCGLMEPRYTNAHHVHRLVPNIKVIVILRNPVDRLYSDFLYFQREAKAQVMFHKTVSSAIKSLNRCIDNVGIRACTYNYTISTKSRARLRVGLYHVYLEEWLSVFPRDQILVVRLEDYARKPLQTIRKINKFLGLKTLTEEQAEDTLEKPVSNTRRPSDKKIGKMLGVTRTLLSEFYRPHNERLANLMGDDRFLWAD